MRVGEDVGVGVSVLVRDLRVSAYDREVTEERPDEGGKRSRRVV